MYRLVLFDVIFNIPIAKVIVKKEDSKTIYDFINKSVPSYRRRGIITDSNQGYDKVMNQLGFTHHQHCIFHLLQRINNKINDKVRKFQVQYKKDLKEANPEYSEKRLNRLTKKAGKKYRKEFEKYHDEIKDIFNNKYYEDAIKDVESIKSKIDEYPDFLAEYLIKNFFPNYKKYLVFLKPGAKGFLEKTNNKCENYIGKILDKSIKGKFKTIMGVFNYILHRIDGWFEKHHNYSFTHLKT